MRRSTTSVTTVILAITLAVALAACSGAGDDGDEASTDVVSGGTFVKSIAGDPGDLNPMQAVTFDTWEVIGMAYEALVYVNPDGELEPWLAEEWTETGTEVVFTLKDGITCADGTPFTAETAAANLAYNTDPANATFYYGSQVTEAVTATADGNTLTVTSAANDPFLVANVGTILMVCDTGLTDPTALSETTDGTGLFPLTEAEPGASYRFTRRDDYTWGPDGVTSDTEGQPDAVELRVIGDESTAANLLLSGEINASSISGADRVRVDAAGLEFAGVRNPVGEIMFNERADRAVADPLVREALATAIDRDEVGTVIADGEAIPSVSLVVRNPLLCVPDEAGWTLPETSLERAGELLDQAGWALAEDRLRYKDGEPLTVKFIYDAPTPTHAPAAELVKQTWDQLGVTTELSANDAAAWSEQLYQTFDWDTGWVQVAPGGPVVLSTFFAGATPDEGGLNFMFVDNPEYEALVAQAKEASPEQTCDLWQQAEAELIERFDVFPVADNILPTYMSGATFEMPNFIMPTTIRMLG
ncbi:ABC transporter substrate-binding protein [Jiangella alkaliphila]|uniref:Peptide/nickel transport system substrate-binding protein n=1 Tax=Jiangella alkaliphila TaxID=419479 RepID=A0A1H2KKH6_9ACTN|nr:ABC transporter substrate-binding protein [Jiangella alkaliphila]SDU68891.1 peptide/nickel transport system substrate-binding protein [Jiangella alkaliphila]